MRYFLSFLSFIFIGSLSCNADERPLKVNDTIQLVVFDEESLSTTVKIDSSGSVNFPLIKNVVVAGKTATDVAKEVEQLLESDYIKDANVTVSVVLEFIPKKEPKPVVITKPAPPVYRPVAAATPAEKPKPLSKVTVLGEVRAPGTLQFEGTTADILTILAQVRGLTPLANPKKVQVRRVGDDAKVFIVDVNKLQASTEQVFVHSGDIITVKKRVF